jgi:hypothetical protein
LLVVQLIGNGSLKFVDEASSIGGPAARAGTAWFCRLPGGKITPELLDLATHFTDLLSMISHSRSVIEQTSSTLLQGGQPSLDVGKSRLDASDDIAADRQLAGDGFTKAIHRILQGIDLPIHPSYILANLAQKMEGMAFRFRHVQVSHPIGLKYIFFSQ